MYSINPLMRAVLITSDEVIFHAPTKHILDPRMIESSIIVAEERFIRPLIGSKLYNLLVSEKNREITNDTKTAMQLLVGNKVTLDTELHMVNALEYMSTDNKKLWKEQLWKLVAECVITASYPEGFVQFGSEGTLHNNPPAGLMVTSGFVTPLLSSIKWSVDKKVQDRISPLSNSLHQYLCTNKIKYPLYDKDCSDCENHEKALKFAGIALDVYDQTDDRCCEPGWMLR